MHIHIFFISFFLSKKISFISIKKKRRKATKLYNYRVLYTKRIIRGKAKDDDISKLVLERRPWIEATSSISTVIFSFSSEGPDILSYCPPTTAIKLSYNSSDISERRRIMESYHLLHRYFRKVYNVTMDIVFHTWVARICFRGCWKGEIDIRCLLMTLLASIASFASYNKRLEWRIPHTADPQENR